MSCRPPSSSPPARQTWPPAGPTNGEPHPFRDLALGEERSRLHLSSRLTAGLCAITLVLLASAGQGYALDVAGAYRVQGTNPEGAGEYRGDVLVRKVGDAYQVVWVIGGQRHVGTGLLTDGVLSIAYQQSNRSAGIAVYRQDADGVLRGRWTPIGGTASGTETWVAKDRT